MANTEPQRWEVHDRYGNRIYITAERRQHVNARRPWLQDHFEDLLETLRKGRRKQDPMDPGKYKYYWPCNPLLPEYTHLVAVVRFSETTDPDGDTIPDNFMVTAWAVFLYGRR